MIHRWGIGVEQTWSLVSLSLEDQDCWSTCNPENWVLLPKTRDWWLQLRLQLTLDIALCSDSSRNNNEQIIKIKIKTTTNKQTNHKNNNVPTSLNCHFWLSFPVPQAVGLNSQVSTTTFDCHSIDQWFFSISTRQNLSKDLAMKQN